MIASHIARRERPIARFCSFALSRATAEPLATKSSNVGRLVQILRDKAPATLAFVDDLDHDIVTPNVDEPASAPPERKTAH